jgi:hypothetical protein
VQGAAKPNLQGGSTPVLPRDPRQGVPVGAQVTSAGIFKSMGALGTLQNRVVVPARQATYAGGIFPWNRYCFLFSRVESGGKEINGVFYLVKC